MHQPGIAAKDIAFINLIPNDVPVRTDKEVIQFINRNLIHNAVKFSPPGGKIIISATCETNELIVSIQDEGEGMTAEQQQKLFSIDKESVYNHTSSAQKGAGVALTICKEYIDRLQGRIWSESEFGMGTTLFYSIPVSSRNTVPCQ